jgi:hypothetical protein
MYICILSEYHDVLCAGVCVCVCVCVCARARLTHYETVSSGRGVDGHIFSCALDIMLVRMS